MNNFRIFETNRFIKDLDGDFKGKKDKIHKKLQDYVYPQLKSQPYFGKNIERKNEVWDVYMNITKANRILGWFPKTSFAEGLKKIIANGKFNTKNSK